MKSVYWLGLLISVLIISCGKENRWEVDLPEEKVKLEYTDLSKEFFDTNIPLLTLQTQYPFFFDNSVDNNVWEEQRRDVAEKSVYDSVSKVFSKSNYRDELEKLFAHYKFYFPKNRLPKVYVYSSALQNIYEPVLFSVKDGMLFIALDGFLGSKSELYARERVYPYMAQNMNPENIAPAVVKSIGKEIIPFNPRQQTFGDLMVDEGKKLILADALLPETADHLKIGYTPEKYKWAQANEGNVWNYFVEQNMVFENDKSLRERFLDYAPYSKFLNEIETDSPGRMGAYIGWQICKAYLDKNPEVTLEQFLITDTQTIFNGSKYKPEKGDGNYTPTKPESNDEVKKYE